ncbi:hypothetical protein AA21952_1397 [Acetobacter oeni LMG 21952]|nr:hypothetical protein AA21952_1397 [Acetobacter oeni LMG 21952]
MRDFGTDTVFVTFNNRAETPSADAPEDRFWADTFFAKLGYSAIGIVSRAPNWFPPDEMSAVAEAIRPRLRGKRVVTYGSSMGGYAALKFSNLLGAGLALAFSPQWSNNPADVGTFDCRWTSLYDPALQGGVAITAGDLHGKCFIFLDPHEREDREHGDRLTALPGVTRIVAPFTWHATLGQLISSSGKESRQLMELATDPRTGTAERFRQLFRVSRRTSRSYHETKFHCVASRLERGGTARFHELAGLCADEATQEARLLKGVMLFLDGEPEAGLELVQRETPSGLHHIHVSSLERVLRIYRIRGFVEGEILLRRALRDREPENGLGRLNFAGEMEALGRPEAGIADLIALCRERDVTPWREEIGHFARRVNSRELLVALLGDDLIFDGAQVSVVSQMTDSETVVIVFDGTEGRMPDEFEGSRICHRSGLSVIGILSPSWFPPDEMERAVSAIAERTDGRRVVTTGHHVGGYAAFRYAYALGAELTVAFAPRFCREGAGRGDAGGPIESADLPARGLIVSDPRQPDDRYHAELIAARGSITIVPARFTWGSPERYFAGVNEPRLPELFRDLSQVTAASLRQALRASRRQAEIYNYVLYYDLLHRFETRGDFRALFRSLVSGSDGADHILADALLMQFEDPGEAPLLKLRRVLDNPHAQYDSHRFWALYRKSGWREGALALARAMHRTDAGNIDVRIMLVASLFDLKKYDEALIVLFSALPIEDRHRALIREIAETLVDNQRNAL